MICNKYKFNRNNLIRLFILEQVKISFELQKIELLMYLTNFKSL